MILLRVIYFVMNALFLMLNQLKKFTEDALEAAKDLKDLFYNDSITQSNYSKTSRVRLQSLRFDDDQSNNDEKIKFNEDRTVVTRIGRDYHSAYVYLHTMESNKFTVIQILEIDDQHIGGINLYLEWNGHKEFLFADKKCQLYDHIIIWVKPDELFWVKDGIVRGRIRTFPREITSFKLVGELYGPVKQIRAFVGYLEEKTYSKQDTENDVDHSSSKGSDESRGSTTVLDPPESDEDSKISLSNVASTSGKTCPKEGTENHVNSSSEGSDKSRDPQTVLGDHPESVEDGEISSPIVASTSGSLSGLSSQVGTNSADPSDGSNIQSTHSEIQDLNGIPYLTVRISYPRGIVETVTARNLLSAPTLLSNTAGPLDSNTNENSNDVIDECIICMEAKTDTVLIPCGHLAFCFQCSSSVTFRCGAICPICRTEIKSWQKIYDRSVRCKLCGRNRASIVLVPCGDLCLCPSCSIDASECPNCLMPVRSQQKVINVM